MKPILIAASLMVLMVAVPQLSAAPATPTNVTASCSKFSSDLTGFFVDWDLGAGDQTGVQIWINVPVYGWVKLYEEAPSSDTFAFLLLENVYVPSGTTVQFTMRTFTYANSTYTYSAYSPNVDCVIPASTAWTAPSGVAVTFNGSVPHVTWTDNSVLEDVFEVQARDTAGGGGFDTAALLRFNLTQADLANYFRPGRTYELRIRARRWLGAYKTSTADYTTVSNTVTFTVPGAIAAGPAAPSAPVVTASKLSTNFYGYKLGWTDNASDESGFEIWMPDSTVAGGRTQLAEVGANGVFSHAYLYAGTGSPYGYPIGSPVLMQVRAFTGTTTRTYSDWSSMASLVVPSTTAWSAPSALAATTIGGAPHLTWTDNSDYEDVFQLEGRDTSVVGSSFQLVTQVLFNLGQFNVSNFFQAGKTYEVRMRARRWNSSYGVTADYTGYTNTVTLVMPGAIAGPPAAPLNLTAAANISSSIYSYGLHWDDVSTDDTGFEVQEKVTGQPDTSWVSLGVLSAPAGTSNGMGLNLQNSYTAGISRDFRVRSVRGSGPFAVTSTAFTNVVTAAQAVFNAPADVRLVAPADNGLIQLFWSDNATTEEGYEIEYRIGGTGAFTAFSGTLTSVDYSRYQNGGGIGTFPPSTQVEIRLRAYNGGTSRVYTGYSNTATVTMPDMTAATNLQQGAASTDGVLNLTWTDNSQNDAGYAIEVRRTLPLPADASFGPAALFTATSATTAALNTQHVIPGYTYEIRVRAANQVSGSSPIIYSPSSNVVTLTVPPIAAPSGLQTVGGTLSEKSVTLSWTDNSSIEGGFNIYSRPAGSASTPVLVGKRASNATATATSTVSLTPGTSTEFFVEAFIGLNPSGEVVSAMSPGLVVNAPDAMTSPVYVEIHRNEAMSTYMLATTTGSAVVTRSISGLPAGLAFNSTNGELTGTPTGTGVTQCPVQVTFANGWTHNNTLAIRILQAPVANAFPAQSLLVGGGTTSVPLAGKFTDPDASSAVRVNTNLSSNGGNMDFILFDSATPLHVANFMGYVNRGDYTNTVFHRSIAGFISQGGAYRPDAAPTAFTAVTTQAPVTNEPGISNIRGTVALAKLDGQPSSGTNQFFVNLANNGPNLDFQNSGFTAFARVTAPGMVVADQLAGLPAATYSVTVGGSANTFADFPVNSASAPSTMNNTLAVKINSVAALPVLTHSLVSNSTPSVATAALVGGNLNLTPVAPGSTSVVIRATDLEGRFVDQTVTVTVANTFANWASTQGLPVGQDGPAQDADGDGDTNLEEFAFLTGPMAAGEFSQFSPQLSSDKGCITFKVRKFANLTYAVEASDGLSANGWTVVWTSADGFGHANVVSAVDQPDHTVLTVCDSTALSAGGHRFLRVKVTAP